MYLNVDIYIMINEKACLMKNYMESPKVRMIMQLSILIGIIGSLTAPLAYAQNAVNNVQNVLCGIVTTVSQVLSILALMMFILGGTLYAFAHLLPATGTFRGNMQGWGMGMLLGGIIALILYIIAPFIVNSLISVNPNGTVGSANTPGLVNSGQCPV